MTPVTLSDLPSLTKAELIAAWSATFGQPPAVTASRELLLYAFAWRIQERRFGGLSPSARRRLKALARAFEHGGTPRAIATALRLRPGTALLKEWRGRKHVVSVLERDFVYQDKHYRSLSEIARVITGTRWNGPAFFGLRKGNGRQAELIYAG